MPPERILLELLKLAERVGISVRHDAFDLRVLEGKGGLCWIRGRPVVVVDAGAPILDRIGVVAEALSAFGLEPIYLPPSIRARLQPGGRARFERRQAGHVRVV